MAKKSGCENGCCGGSGGGSGGGSEPEAGGRRAAGVDAGIKDANLKQLRRIEGQVRGIASMIEEDRYCADVITQVAAVRESLHTVAKNLMRNHLKHCAAAAMERDGAGRDEMIEELLELAGKLAR